MDVRATVSAAKADTFFFVRPGTDYAMNLAVLHVLISEKLYDPHMLPYIDGFGELEERVRPCTPEWAETETGIKADRIVRLARELAEAAPHVLWYPGWFTARYADSFVTVRSAYLINAPVSYTHLFNFRVAKITHGLGIPVYYFIPPKIWAWRTGRVRFLQRYVKRLFCILPFEPAFYAKHGVQAVSYTHLSGLRAMPSQALFRPRP